MFELTSEQDSAFRVLLFAFGLATAFICIVFFQLIKPSEYQRIYLWIVSLPGIRKIRQALISEPALFGERRQKVKGPKFPPFIEPPESLRAIYLPLRIALLLFWFLLIVMPYLLYWLLKQLYLVVNATTGVRRDKEELLHFRDADSFFRNMSAGHRLSEGGRKGSKLKNEATAERNAKILNEARRLIEAGRSPREVPGILHQRFSHQPGYPGSVRMYRNIVSELKRSGTSMD